MVHPRLSRAAPRRVQAQMAATDPFSLSLSELVLRLLDLVCGLRVVTQNQLELLHADVPSRTLRYSTRQLHRLGLIGRTRPYRDVGSSPYHLWPTNRADALVRGERPARRGERHPPNPLFLAHAASLSELFIVLHTQARHAGLTLLRFAREGEGREDFRDADGRRRAIVPDAHVTFSNGDGVPLSANVELDLGTMTHARLRMKLRGFLDHARWRADEGVAPLPPAVLFITTSAQREHRLLTAADTLREAAHPSARSLAIAACTAATHLHSAVTTPCWRAAGSPRRSGSPNASPVRQCRVNRSVSPRPDRERELPRRHSDHAVRHEAHRHGGLP